MKAKLEGGNIGLGFVDTGGAAVCDEAKPPNVNGEEKDYKGACIQ